MRLTFVISAVAVLGFGPIVETGAQAWAADGDGQNASVGAQASGGQLTVQAGSTYWTPPSGSSVLTGDSSSEGKASGSGDQSSTCTYAVGSASVTALLGVGGPEPGEWVFPTCPNSAYIDPMEPVWVTGAQPAAAVGIQVNPAAMAQQAVKQLGLGAPVIDMAPPAGSPQLVGVPTWLWINPAAWKALTASATAGTVTATAAAAPSKVVWEMGNGQSVTCDGPGTPYSSSEPSATTDCSYTWTGPGSYQVTATVYWSVTWTAAGAPGGGNLGLVPGEPSTVPVAVTESQAINTPSGGSG
jgi:hypothetical protein